jgi:hypothetical protein
MALLLAGVAGCSFDASGARSAPGGDGGAADDTSPRAPDGAAPIIGDAAAPVLLRIEAQIDGRSRLLLTRDVAQWLHLEFAAPGRHDGEHLPTLIDGVAWFPVWPDEPDDENRDCECTSDVGTVLAPPLPAAPSVATLTPVEVRVAASVVQQPAAENDFTTIVELDDTDEAGSDIYVVELEVAPAPAE